MSRRPAQAKKRLESLRSTVQCNTRISRGAKELFEQEVFRRRIEAKTIEEAKKITMGSVLREVLEQAAAKIAASEEESNG